MTALVNEDELLQLSVGDFVAVMTRHMGDGKAHYTLGSVEKPPYVRDVEIRLWEKQRDEDYNEDDLTNDEEAEALMARIAEVKSELQKSIDEADALTEQLRARRASIMKQMEEANEYVAESKAVMHAARDDVESIPDHHWNELKSYRVPPKTVPLVIRAVMLLLSEDEARTWPQMQRILRDFNFKSRVTTYDSEQQLSPERREYILQECVSKKGFRYDRVLQGSVAVGPIYYWVLAQLDCGEAQSNKTRVDKEKVARQKELRRVLKQLNEQQARIAEYQALMDDLDDQLRRCREHAGKDPAERRTARDTASRFRMRSLAAARYENSFAGEQKKEYLRQAFYTWRPTERVIIVMRKNLICDFGRVTKQEQVEGYNMSEPQVRLLDEALLRRQAQLDAEDAEARRRREEAEERQLEADMFAQNAAEREAAERDDEDILRERALAAADGKPTPAPSPREDEVTDRLERKFEGKCWQKVLDRKRDLIVQTFTEESAECLEVPDYYVSIADLAVGSLNVDFDVSHNGKRTADELQGSVNSFEYPKMKKLYEDELDAMAAEEGGRQHQMKFGGDRWIDVVPDHHAELVDAFRTDTGKATSVSGDQVEVVDARAGEEGLTVDYLVHDRELFASDVQELVDRFEYPRVWALYQRIIDDLEPGPLHQVRFRGERWKDLLQGNEAAIAKAFTLDTATVLEVPERRIQTEDIHYDDGLTVPYTVAARPLDEDVIDERVEGYKYPETWALYDRLIAEACGAKYQKAFDGEYWEAVLSEARPELSDAFCTDSAEALQVTPPTIEPRSLDTDQDRLLVSFNVLDDNVEEDRVRGETKTYAYPVTWALYARIVKEQQEAVKNMQCDFIGASWCAMVEDKHDPIQEAFRQDVAEQLAIPAEAITVHETTADKEGMAIRYGVDHEGMIAYDVRKGLEGCAYPRVWELYEELSEEELARRGFRGPQGLYGNLERRFEGDGWQRVVDERGEELQEAFKKDEADCLGQDQKRSMVTAVAADEAGVVIGYDLARRPPAEGEAEKPADPTREDVEERIAAYGFPTVWSVYEDLIFVRSSHQVGFDGEDWKYVVQDQKPQLEEAFTTCTAALFGLRPANVKNATYAVGSLIVDFELQHPADLNETEINEKLNACPYEQVWDLYGAHPYDPEETTETAHELGFEGVGWQNVLGTDRSELERAFVSEIAKALEIEEPNVKITDLAYEEESLVVKVDVVHSVLQDDELIQEQLKRYPYTDVWDLYREDWGSEVVTTSHQIGFDGDDWHHVVVKRKAELDTAFVSSVAQQLELEAESVSNVRYACTDDSLLVDFDLTHPGALSEEECNDKLAACPFDAVWTLYCDGSCEADGPLTTTHEIGFEGDAWAGIEEKRQDQLTTVIAEDTAEALGLAVGDVNEVVTSVAGDLLVAKVRINHHTPQDQEAIQEQLSAYPYRRVWALYEVAAVECNTRQSAEMERVFEGDDWGELLESSSDELRGAFQRDAANALGITPDRVRVVSTNIGSLVVKYKIVDPPADDDEIRRRIDEDEFEEVMGMYRRRPRGGDDGDDDDADGEGAEDGTGAFKKNFPGEYWADCTEENHASIEKAFRRDTADAMDMPQESIAVRSVTADKAGLRVGYDVAPPSAGSSGTAPTPRVDRAKVKARTEAYEYPAVWALYGDLRDYVTTPHALRFEAEGWEYIVRRRRWELCRAIADDAAEALDVTPDALVDTDMECAEDALSVGTKFTHRREVTVEEVTRRLEDCPFYRVWELYELLTPSDVMKKHFQGNGWTRVHEEKREQLRRAFADDTAKSLNVSRLEVEVKEVAVSEEGANVSYVVRGSTLQGSELAARAKEYPYPRTWALYADDVAADKRFDGEYWGDVVRDRREDLMVAFTTDTAAAAAVSKDSVAVRQILADQTGLEVDYQVNPGEAKATSDSRELKKKIDAYAYPKTWELYGLIASEREAAAARDRAAGIAFRESGTMTRSFDGDDWAPLLEGDSRGEVDDAFRTGAARGAGVPKSNIIMVDAKVGSLQVSYKVRGCPLEDDEIDARMQKEEFPELMDLYKRRARSAAEAKEAAEAGEPPVSAGWEETHHQVGFDGAFWPFIVQNKQEELHQAIKDDVAGSLGIQPADVRDVDAHVDEQLLINFTAHHPETLSESEVDAKLKACPYESLWNLYGANPIDPKAKIVTSHHVGFEGEDWPYVVGKKREEVIGAFTAGTAKALEVPESDVTDIVPESGEDGMTLHCKIHHTAMLDEEHIQSNLQTYPYEEVWALYEVRPYDPNEKVETVHEIVFEGASWKVVCELEGEEVRRAIAEDTAVALDVDSEDVVEVEYDVTVSALTARAKVRHSPLQDTEWIEEMLTGYEYPNVWALYDRCTESPPMTKTFPGAGWPAVSVGGEEAIKEAFLTDTATMLNLGPNYISVKDVGATQREGLTVKYTVFGNAFSPEEIGSRAESYPYPHVWGLYEAKGGAAARAAGADEPTAHAVSFEASDWEFVMQHRGSEVHEAIHADTAEALGIPPHEVVSVQSEVAGGALQAMVEIAAQPAKGGLTSEDIQSALDAGGFPRTWALYCPQDEAPRTTKRIEGPAWGAILSEDEEPVRAAFAKDTADALGARPGDIAVDEVTPDKEGMTIAYRVHFTRDKPEEIDERTGNYPYPVVWALYHEESVVTRHWVRFNGKDWARTVEEQEAEVRQALVEDTAQECEVPPEKVTEVKFDSDGSGTTATFAVEHPSYVTAESLQQRVRAAKYPKVWALYVEMTTTSHEVGFEGEDWGDVWSTKEAEVRDRYNQDVADALGVPGSRAEAITMEKSTDGIVFSGDIRHPKSMTKEEVDTKLREHQFPKLWKLYAARFYGPDDLVDTQHLISFEGDAWGYVLEIKKEEVHAAATRDTAAALNLEPEAVLQVTSAATKESLDIEVTVRHSPMQDEEVIQKALASCEYAGVWSLYCTPCDGPVATRYFEGEHWDAIVEAEAETGNEAIKEAFVNDTSRALNSAPEAIYICDIATDADGMTVTYAVPTSQEPVETVEETGNNYPYPQVWSLYRPLEEPPTPPIPHSKNFPGDNWDQTLEHKRAEVDEAFRRDTAKALGVDPQAVEVTSVFTTPQDGMTVTYHVDDTEGKPTSAEDVDRTAGANPYPAVWDLYEESEAEKAAAAAREQAAADARESGTKERSFDGDEWAPLLEGDSRGEVEDAFRTGAARALGVPKSNITVLDAKVGSLQVSYKVRGCPLEDDEIDARMQEEEFPELMDLYKRRARRAAEAEAASAREAAEAKDAADAKEAAARASAPPTASLAVRFDGDDWDYVLEKKTQAVTRIFKEETATALGIPTRSITITEFVLGSLLVHFRVRHDGTLSDEALSAKIDAYPYEKVWELYEDRPKASAGSTDRALSAAALSKKATSHEVGFIATNWEYVDRIRHEPILTAFAQAAAVACHVHVEDVQAAEVMVYPNMMKITAQILHPANVSADQVNTALDAYRFHEVWALYEDETAGHETKTLTKTFEGSDWAPIAQSSKGALTEAFRADTSRCLGLPRSSVTVKALRAGSLVVEYTVCAPPSMSEADVLRLTGEYPYPEVWALYKPRAGSAQGISERAGFGDAPAQRLFKGGSWDIVVEKQRTELKRAFTEDTAEATHVSTDAVDLISLYTTEGGLVMNYRVEKDGASKADVEKAVRAGEYPKVWALYRVHADDSYVTSEHGVGFDGEDWDYVVERNRKALTDTFSMCVAELLDLQSRHVQNLRLNLEPDNSGIAVSFTLRHPRNLTKASVDAKLEVCPFDPVWQLYETRPYDPTRMIVTSHEVRFDGEDWDLVLEKKRDLIVEAFTADVAEAMSIEPSAVNGIRVEKTEAGMVIGANVHHSPLQDEEMIQEELERHDFARVWALYESRTGAGMPSDQSMSTHQVGFEGERWAEVMSHRRAKVVEAIRIDSAAALQVNPESIVEVTTDEQPDIMICTMTIRHPREQTEDVVQEQLSQYEYDRVWALYDDTIAPRVDVLKNRANTRVTGPMKKRFDGVDWDLALGEYPERIREAFAVDTAEVLQCQVRQIMIDSMTLGSLLVQYRVRDMGMTEKQATQLTDNYAYPNVWALYKPRAESGSAARSSAGPPLPSRTPPAPLPDSVTRRSTRRSPSPASASATGAEQRAQQAAEAARRTATAKGAEAARAVEEARKAREALEAADAAARAAEAEAQRALERARERRAAALAAAQAAQAEEDRRAAEAMEEAQRAVDAAQRAEAAAEEARRRRAQPLLETVEAEGEQESVAYLRKALADARRERDEYQDKLEEANARQKNIAGMRKDLAQMRADTPPAGRAPAKK